MRLRELYFLWSIQQEQSTSKDEYRDRRMDWFSSQERVWTHANVRNTKNFVKLLNKKKAR